MGIHPPLPRKSQNLRSTPCTAMCGSSAVWPLLRSGSIPPEHPSPSLRQTAASKRNGAKRFLAVTWCQMGGREAARESRDERCQPNCVQQEVQLVNQTQHWNCTSARCNSHTWCISQFVLYRFPTTPSVKDATIAAPHRWGGNPGSLRALSKAPCKQSFHAFGSSSRTVADLVQRYESNNACLRYFLC